MPQWGSDEVKSCSRPFGAGLFFVLMLLFALISLYRFSCCKLEFPLSASFRFAGINSGNELKESCQGGLSR
jgi:hypothetical protein